MATWFNFPSFQTGEFPAAEKLRVSLGVNLDEKKDSYVLMSISYEVYQPKRL